jgi:uncharacterized delta-60 repeat protein
VARYNPNGSLDTTFGNFGIVITAFGNGNDSATKVAIQGDGKIVVAGVTFNGANEDFAMARYNTDGSLDTTFGNLGKVTTSIGSGDNAALDLVIQADGKIVVAGYAHNGLNLDIALARYNSNGALDAAFGNQGIVITNIGGNEVAAAVVIQVDNKIVVASSFPADLYRFAALRYNVNGSPDSTFGNGGLATVPVGDPFNSQNVVGARSIDIQDDGRILVSGNARDLNSILMSVIVRFTSSGLPDTTFSGNGLNPVFTGNEFSALHAIRLIKGKIVAAGTIAIPGRGLDFVVARFKLNGQFDNSFGVGGLSITPINADIATDIGLDMAIQDDDKVVVAGFTFDGSNNDFAVARYMGGNSGNITRSLFDFDSDGRSDMAVFRPSDGTWRVRKSRDTTTLIQNFGLNGDLITPGDYDGDAQTDFAVFRPGTATWYLQQSTAGFAAFQWGLSGDKPVPGDYDGDGKTDIAVWRPSNGTWYVLQSFSGQPLSVPFGVNGDVPALGDYDGDSKSDIAVYRPSNGTWFVLRSSDGGTTTQPFGLSDDVIAPGDYDGDGKTDFAVFRKNPDDPATWHLLQSFGGEATIEWGVGGDRPVPGDYDGDGKTDIAVWRPSDGTWYVLQSSDLQALIVQFGVNGDKPIPAAYIPQPGLP